MTQEIEAGMPPVTAQDMQKAIADHGVTRWKLRECSICDAPLYYLFSPDGAVAYNSSCWCSRVYSPPEPRSYDDVARTLNIQTPEVRKQMFCELIGADHADA